MKREVIKSETEWEKPYGFSQGMVLKEVSNLIFLAGQASMSPEGAVVEGDIGAQTRQAYDNVVSMLGKAGLTMDDVVYERINLVNMADLLKALEVRSRFYKRYPPSTYVQVASLALPQLLIEVEVVAAS